MFVKQQRTSLCRTVLLIVFLELIFVVNSISNQTICGNSNTRSTAYITVSNDEVNWSEAKNLCNKQNAILPVICNQQEQDALTDYLKANIRYSSVWTSGKKTEFNEWRWVDGQRFNGNGLTNEWDPYYTHALLTYRGNYEAEDPSYRESFLCQYSGSSCNSEDVINVTKGCVRPNVYPRGWYDARSDCLRNGGDLAILGDDDLITLNRSGKLRFSPRSFWIGLRKNALFWTWQPSVESEEEVKYWSSQPFRLCGDFLSVDVSNGKWRDQRRCISDRQKVVCQTSLNSAAMTSSSTTTATTERQTKQQGTVSSSTPSTPSRSTTTDFLARAERDSSEFVTCNCGASIVVVVILSLIVIVVSNIVVALVVRRYINRRANASSSDAAKENNLYQDLEATRKQANPDGTYAELQLQPVYEEVSQRRHK